MAVQALAPAAGSGTIWRCGSLKLRIYRSLHVITEPKKAAEYRRNAAICLTMARDASEGDRAVLLEIAQDWTEMAAECEHETEPMNLPPSRSSLARSRPNQPNFSGIDGAPGFPDHPGNSPGL